MALLHVAFLPLLFFHFQQNAEEGRKLFGGGRERNISRPFLASAFGPLKRRTAFCKHQYCTVPAPRILLDSSLSLSEDDKRAGGR